MSDNNNNLKGDGPPSGPLLTLGAENFMELSNSPTKLPSILKNDKNTDSAKIIEVIPDDI
jgi:hypothetical protein